jgi:hypothetical protein
MYIGPIMPVSYGQPSVIVSATCRITNQKRFLFKNKSEKWPHSRALTHPTPQGPIVTLTDCIPISLAQQLNTPFLFYKHQDYKHTQPQIIVFISTSLSTLPTSDSVSTVFSSGFYVPASPRLSPRYFEKDFLKNQKIEKKK